MFRGHHRINKGMLLSRMYRARGVLYGVITLGLLTVVLICALLVRFLAGIQG